MKKLLALLLAFVVVAAWAGGVQAAPPLQGQVLEVINSGPYTYLRLKTRDGETWAAVNPVDVKKGEQVTIQNPMVMTNFESKALKRKFDTIIFGSVGGGAPGQPAASNASSPHGSSAKPADVEVKKVTKATGPDGRTVAEVYAQRSQLKNKSVAVRGTVAKFLPGIMGKNWVHLRDGTGAAADGSNDLLVTTKQTTKVGSVVTVKGVVHTDVDLGMDYTYKVLVEEATLQP